ncbi:DUF4190 domain-containing protein [Streptomyces sp. S07_1.15]|uniref:DUF4190 domain-containing protein n=1 Tax=Streptomyces sp. S07_1.15 TaxID=2873925 RepID=UPI001D1525D2|nr:DUF4190 domain-containing protein [Streptomyces sp. S07_1.15]MCC3654409.1 DUF4190 domain-containing protein [Streptomyces sp. S07_1.15]
MPPPAPPALNPLAVTALVTSLLCLAPLGLIFGIVALVQISRKKQRGKGLAIAGISISGAVLALVGIAVAVADFRVWTLPARDDTGEVAKRGWTTVHSVEVGDCFNPGDWLPGRDTPRLADANVELVPCDASHRGEVYATFELAGEREFPGRDEIAAVAWSRCARLYLDYSMDPVAFGRLQSYYFYPEQRDWDAGRRTVLCWVARPGEAELDTSVRRDASHLEPAQLAYLSALKPLNAEAVLRPVKSPRQDLAGARKWAGRMAEAQAETIRLLKDADLPGAERPAGKLVAELEAGLPFWRQASRASDTDGFLERLRSVEKHDGEAYRREIRGRLDLPLAPAESAERA